MPYAPDSPQLDARSLALRRLVVRALRPGKRGHVGSAMSPIEILRVLYDDILHFRADQPRWPDRDRLVFSKGHGCLALYALLADKGFFPLAELDRFCQPDGMLGGHPEAGKVPGVEASTGALGHGLPIAVGLALAARMAGRPHRVWALLGDGETNEGSVWEAALSAGKHRLANLVAIIDYNKLQSFGPTALVQDMEPFADKWRAFNFAVAEVDGHDPGALRRLFASMPLAPDRPSVVIAHTVKGKGIPFAEFNPEWHHKSKISESEFAALDAILGTDA
jgi:transketolase